MNSEKQLNNNNEISPLSVVIERPRLANCKPINDSDFMTTSTRIKPNEFLLQYPRGTYTTARTVNRTAIMDLPGHIDRMCFSMQLMKFFPNSENLSNERQCIDSGENIEKKEPMYITQELAPYRNHETLKDMAVPLLKMGLKKYYEIEEDTPWHVKGVGEARVTLIACYSFDESCPRLDAHISPLHTPSSSKCRVEIYGEPRKAARAKDSQWIRDRKTLESAMHPGFDEVLLSDSNTHNIYEGISSNFFAVMHNPDTRQPLVVTAPLHSVLEGTIMRIVVMICERDGIDLKFWFPNLDDVAQWKGAFITSTSRLVLPIEMIRFHDGRPIMKLPLDNVTVNHIKKEVDKEILNRTYNIL